MPGSREERVARRGARVDMKPYYRRRVEMGAPGWWVRNRIPQSPKLLAAKVVERDRQLRCGQFEVCASQDGHELVRLGHKISPAFMISQKEKDRLICDDRRGNTECYKRSVQYDPLQMVETLAGKRWWFQSRDVEDGYGHVAYEVGEQKQKTLDMGVIPGDTGPRFVQCASLNFGYVNSPHLFCAQVKAGPIKKLRKLGVRVLCYVDDFLICSPTREKSLRDGKLFDAVFLEYGYALHNAECQVPQGTLPGARGHCSVHKKECKVKGVRVPTQVIDHLGLRVDSVRNLFLVPPKRLREVRKMARQMLGAACGNRRRVNARWLAQFAGLAISLLLAVPMGRYHTRAFFDALVAAGVYGMTTAELRACGAWDRLCTLNKQCFRELKWWGQLGKGTSMGRAVWRPPVTTTMAADASGARWAGVLNRGPVQAERLHDMDYWSHETDTVPAWGIWSVWERKHHIGWKELRAFRLSLEAFGAEVAGRVLLLWEDNAGVVSILTNYTSRSPELMTELRLCVRVLQALDVELRVRWVASEFQAADFWTRFQDKAEWQLAPHVAHGYMHVWGQCTVDRFAVMENALLPRFNAPYPCPGAECVDAFTASWEGERNWLNPPWTKMAKVLHKLECEPAAEAVLVAPVWPTAPWWPVLMSLVGESLYLPISDSTVHPGTHCRGVAEPLRNPYWHVRVWHVPTRV